MSMARVVGAGSRRVIYAAAGVDSPLPSGTGPLPGIASPLSWTLLIGPVGAALLDGNRGALRITAIALGSAVVAATAVSPLGLAAFPAALALAVAVILGAAAGLWPASRCAGWRSTPERNKASSYARPEDVSGPYLRNSSVWPAS